MSAAAFGQEQATAVEQSVITALRELAAAGNLKRGQLVVIGCSTSEVLGQRIGTSGTTLAAEAIFAGVESIRAEIGFYPLFQCCEHLNRALVVEREAADRYGLEEVAAVPVPKAGGSMAAYAYRALPDAVLVEGVRAHAGIDIGDTFIGMHLRAVAVPVRPSVRTIGAAHVTMAFARPKLIGGARAVYELEQPAGQNSGTCK
ncbi:TIGR01440 family protein [Paenibacillus sp. MMS18-CY102]|uniref:TIGR01440 family protein n=1 Tax=Paenibacillus sp. MMS18-CY102 TaxID=2682849 RepID=UPI001365C240|nr:TIGR01440 family protein [Paenibacillus sp. MMS18-CY102]MWC27264.1 TIGR01440 family protein [Paenibacillus sp. MMS18-CY102]